MRQMWYIGDDVTPMTKSALRICKERGLLGIEKLKGYELRVLLSSQECKTRPTGSGGKSGPCTCVLALSAILNVCLLKCAGLT